MIAWFRKHTFVIHTAAFLIMVLASIPLFFAASAGNSALIIILIGIFAIGNLLVLLVP